MPAVEDVKVALSWKSVRCLDHVGCDSGVTATSAVEVVLVLAVADNGVIGNDNTSPWRLKSDMQRF